MATFNFFGTQTCHVSWDNFFNRQNVQNELLQVQRAIGSSTVTPQSSNIFKVFQTDLRNCKVVILGQDPYPQQNEATGRAFEVGSLNSWNNPINPSLMNIIKILHKNQLRTNMSLPPKDIKTVRNDIILNKFKILSPKLLFDSWENQGVLLLNAALTCPQGNTSQSNAHAKYWEGFTREMIKFIDLNCNNVVWFLWGKNAKAFGCQISNIINKYCSEHPQLNNSRVGSFYYENHFSKIKSINWY